MAQTRNFFIGILLLTCFSAVSLAAQEEAAQEEAATQESVLTVVTETETIDSLKPLVAAAKKSKKPLLINFWATWCGPCRVEFPELVRIDAEYRKLGLDFRIVSLDNPGAKDMLVAGFLRSYGSTMRSYLIDLPTRSGIDRAIREIAPQSRGGLPLTLLFNAKGRLVYQKAGIVDARILRARIDKLLGGKPAPNM